MPTGSGERQALHIVKEVTPGTLPTTPTMTPFWHNSETINPVRGAFESARSLGDRQLSDFRLGRKSGAGDITSELTYENFDLQLEGLLCTTQEAAPFTPIGPLTTISFTAATQTIADSASGLGDIAIADFIYISGAGEGENNGMFKVLTATAAAITVEGSKIIDEAAGASVTIEQADFVNGTTLSTYSIQKHYLDLAIADHYLGCGFNSAALTIPPNGISTINWNILAMNYLADQTPETTLATLTEYRPFSGLTGTYNEAGDATAIMTAFSCNIENNLMHTEPLGVAIAGEVIARKFRVSGSVSFYFQSAAMMTKFWAETITQLVVTLSDPLGNEYVFGFPRVVLTSGSRPKSDDGPLVEQFNWTALRADGSEKTCFVVKRQ
jgi:hypothetical protein